MSVIDRPSVLYAPPRLRLYPAGLRDMKQVPSKGMYERPGRSGGYNNGSLPFKGGYVAGAEINEPIYGNVGF